VKAAEAGVTPTPVYSRHAVGLHWGFAPDVPRVTVPVFVPLTSAPVSLTRQVLTPSEKTSLGDTVWPDAVTADTILVNTYDRFFLRGPAQLDALSVNMAQRSAANQLTFDARLGGALMTYFRRTDQNAHLDKLLPRLISKQNKAARKRKAAVKGLDAANEAIKKAGGITKLSVKDPLRKRKADWETKLAAATLVENQKISEVTALHSHQSLIKDLTRTTASGIGSADTLYQTSVSDHLPITTLLRFP
jgi:hypothetical protein